MTSDDEIEKKISLFCV